ncbi:MAG: hypothetical protein Q7R65_04730 [bacterium]|nr:hypothetical protein [bacterium]
MTTPLFPPDTIEILLILIIAAVFLLPLLLASWLWYFHDRYIKKLREELLDIPEKINENNRARGVTTEIQERQIKAAQRPLETELRRRESSRQLFLDRAHFLSLFKLK